MSPQSKSPKEELPITHWIYRVLRIDLTTVDQVEAVLNEQGAQGWELVTRTTVAYGREAFIFNREA